MMRYSASMSEGMIPVASFTKKVNPRLAKHPLKTNGRLANRGLTSLVKESTEGKPLVDNHYMVW